MSIEGGYQGRTNKLVDGCYSYWQGAVPSLIAQYFGTSSLLSDRENHQKYILFCGQQIEGGLRDKPGKYRDYYHSCYVLSGLSASQHGSGLGKPVVLGDPKNLLVATHLAYNISKTKAQMIKTYFANKIVNQED